MSLSVRNLYCERNGQSLFQEMNFSISRGELLQVVGNNGVGKSSLLRILAGLLRPESGIVLWNDQVIGQSDFYEHLFYLGHAPAIKSELTIFENLSMFPINNSTVFEKMLAVLEAWSLLKILHSPAGQLSQGQWQRVALCRLQLSETLVWILDEPFSNLDKEGVSLCEKLLVSHIENGGMVVLSTHREMNVNVKQKVLEIG